MNRIKFIQRRLCEESDCFAAVAVAVVVYPFLLRVPGGGGEAGKLHIVVVTLIDKFWFWFVGSTVL